MILKNTLLLSASFALILLTFFVSCNKETSFEKALNTAGTSIYSFDGGTGVCTGAIVSGSYQVGTLLTTSNTATINVNVDSIGTYTISTNTVNGISFKGSGVFTAKGPQTITLTASGTPTAAGAFDFKPTATSCAFSVTVVGANGGPTETAIYSFTGGTAACTGATIFGTYAAGTPTTFAEQVDLNIKVDQVGTYNISTNTAGGFKFSATGTFTATGVQTITLTASGTPTAAGNFTFKPAANACSFTVSVVAGGNPGGGGGTGSGNFLRCKINGVMRNFNAGLHGYYVTPPNAGIPYSIHLQGKNSDVANSVEELWVTASNPTPPTTGAYSNGTLGIPATSRQARVALYPSGFPNLFWGSSALTANTMTINLTSVSTSGAEGTFQGTIHENNGVGPGIMNVTEGAFKISF